MAPGAGGEIRALGDLASTTIYHTKHFHQIARDLLQPTRSKDIRAERLDTLQRRKPDVQAATRLGKQSNPCLCCREGEKTRMLFPISYSSIRSQSRREPDLPLYHTPRANPMDRAAVLDAVHIGADAVLCHSRYESSLSSLSICSCLMTDRFSLPIQVTLLS